MTGTIIGILIVLGIFIAFTLKNLIYICEPNEVLIFCGKQMPLLGNRTRHKVGYRFVKAGSSLKRPIVEDVFRIDITNMTIDVKVDNAYSAGGIPLTVNGVANIKVSGNEPLVHNAIERFIGKTRKEIIQIAQETLEGNLRGVLASLTPEQINEDKQAFQKKLVEEADEDLTKLGMVLDNLQIQNISDRVNYLDSIGRKQTAQLHRDAAIAEATNKSTSIIQDASNKKNTTLRQLEAKVAITKQDATRRYNDAVTRRKAVVSEAQTRVIKNIARTKGDIQVNKAMIEQVINKLEAEIVKPAEAKRERLIQEAKADSAEMIAEAEARANSLKSIVTSWKKAGANAKNIFLMQKIEPILDTVVHSIKAVEIDKITVIDQKLTGEGGNPIVKGIVALEQIEETTGIDVSGILNSLKRKIGTESTSAKRTSRPSIPTKKA